MSEQHDCSRPGYTRNTAEQECDLHAAEPAGVHEPKEPRRAPTREEFGNLVTSHGEACKRYGFSTYRTSGRKFLPHVGETSAALIAAYSTVCAERDAALKRCGVRGLAPNTLRECDEALTLTDDSRIAAWRALDAEQRSYRVEDLRTWADLVEAGAAPDGADHGPSPLRIAAAALEALGERP